MNMRPYKDIIRMSKDGVDNELFHSRVIKAKKKLVFLIADVGDRIATQESKIDEMCLAKEIDFNALAIAQDELALMERRKKHFERMMVEMFP